MKKIYKFRNLKLWWREKQEGGKKNEKQKEWIWNVEKKSIKKIKYLEYLLTIKNED